MVLRIPKSEQGARSQLEDKVCEIAKGTDSRGGVGGWGQTRVYHLMCDLKHDT